MNKKTLAVLIITNLVLFSAATISADGAAGAPTLQELVNNFASQLTPLGVGLATIGFMVAGIMYVMSSAKPEMMTHAKQALVAAIIGVVIIILAKNACPFIKGMFGGIGECGGGGGN